jgi:multidrug/hemolysin transport system ATP-binding protein
MANIIEISHLSKRFGSVLAVDDLSFCVREGELFAFLGLNGAGKSTTISILCGQLQKDAGCVRVGGVDIDEGLDRIKRHLGVVFQASALDAPLTVRENLRSRGALYGIVGAELDARIDELCALLDLDGLLDRTVGKLSGGQRRRIDIARALLHRPTLLILDEPTTGLDPQTRRLLWDVITELRRREGLTVFLTTHYMEEAADADDIILLDSGRIAAKGSPLELKNTYAGDFLTVYHVDEATVGAWGYPYERVRDGIRLKLASTAEATALILAHPDVFTDYEVTKGNMEDVFLAVTGKALSHDGETGGKKK